MPLQKPMRRKVSAPSRVASAPALSSRSSASSSSSSNRYCTTKVPLAVSVSAFLSVVAIMIGALAASSMQRDDNMLRAEISGIENNFNLRLERLEARLPAAKPPLGEVIKAPTERMAIEASEAETLVPHPNNIADWNESAATTTVEYRDTKHNLKMQLPYNPAWGNAKYKVTPYVVNGDTVSFGPLTLEETATGAHWVRAYSMSVIAPRSEDAALKGAYKDAGGEPTMKSITLKRLDTGPYTVLQFQGSVEATPVGHYEFVGKRYNYIFRKGFYGNDFSLPLLEKILSSLRSI